LAGAGGEHLQVQPLDQVRKIYQCAPPFALGPSSGEEYSASGQPVQGKQGARGRENAKARRAGGRHAALIGRFI
ncbi:MAG TPA: hypothetical protein PLR12_03935, partial [Clostridia bacterium]|nr:hypothetical protein [Clostridia bacterium]